MKHVHMLVLSGMRIGAGRHLELEPRGEKVSRLMQRVWLKNVICTQWCAVHALLYRDALSVICMGRPGK
eukprot:SAG11_NODE_1988_length_3961_cov_2.373900_2_plen_69_part_00